VTTNATIVHQNKTVQKAPSDPKLSKRTDASSFQKYVIEKQQGKQQITQRTPNDSTTKFMISKILNGDLENIATNSSNSNKSFALNVTKSSMNNEKPAKVGLFKLVFYFNLFSSRVFCYIINFPGALFLKL